MRFTVKSIYSQLTISFLFIILITITISTISEYHTYSRKLPVLITEMRSSSIAQNLSSSYTADRGWENLDREIQRLRELDSLNTNDDANLRIVIRDIEGKTVYNSFAELTSMNSTELTEGQSKPVTDYESSETVGSVTIYISSDYINRNAEDYITDLLKTGVYKSLITAAAAFILSLLLSRYITAPIIQLTKAADSIAGEGSSRPINFSSSNEIGRLGSAFNKMLKSLQTQRNLRKQLLSDISHEINTPLNTIRLEARGLSDGLVAAEEASINIISEVDKLGNIIYDLDWLAETDSGAYVLNLQECKISKLLAEEADRWRNKAETRNIKLLIETADAADCSLQADPIRISTVIGNLIDNAVKYSPEGSVIKTGCSLKEDMLEIHICDNGPAIAAEDREAVFQRFYRSDRTGELKTSGRGLGLAISKHIIELHGGALRLECGAETGNCFIFTVPA